MSRQMFYKKEQKIYLLVNLLLGVLGIEIIWLRFSRGITTKKL